MGAMDARRLELYELLKPRLDEEAAQKLVLALPPEPERLVTKDDLASLESRLDGRLAQLEATLTRRMVSIHGRVDDPRRIDRRLCRRAPSLTA